GIQGGTPIDSECSRWINEALEANPGYLLLHQKTMQANWHQYIECTSMRVGVLTNIGLIEVLKETLTWLFSTHEYSTRYKEIKHMQYIYIYIYIYIKL
ncbi:hypothetical protein MTR67_018456, partial [Solanum verrucosum]